MIMLPSKIKKKTYLTYSSPILFTYLHLLLLLLLLLFSSYIEAYLYLNPKSPSSSFMRQNVGAVPEFGLKLQNNNNNNFQSSLICSCSSNLNSNSNLNSDLKEKEMNTNTKQKKKPSKKKPSSSSFNNKKEYFEDSLYKELGKLPRPSYPKFHFDILHQHNGDASEGISNVNNTTSRPSHARVGK